MGNTKYAYAVARIRVLETQLLTDQAVEQLLACRTMEQGMQFLAEKGWGNGSPGLSMEEMLRQEEERTWNVIREIAPDAEVFRVLLYPKQFHNLKAAVKSAATGKKGIPLFYEGSGVSGEELAQWIENREFSRLPENMEHVAREAYEGLLRTGDGQRSEVRIDRETLEQMQKEAERTGEPVIREYTELLAAVTNIKVVMRCIRTGKDQEFMDQAVAAGGSLDKENLIRAALSGEEGFLSYLEGTSYRDGAAAWKQSPAAFELWCDNQILEQAKAHQYESFSPGPLLGYLVARENEIKTVRIILTGKQNQFSREEIRERVRRMYG